MTSKDNFVAEGYFVSLQDQLNGISSQLTNANFELNEVRRDLTNLYIEMSGDPSVRRNLWNLGLGPKNDI